MINMIRADFYRIFRSTGIYIALCIMFAIIGISIYDVSPGYMGLNANGITGEQEEDALAKPGNPVIDEMTYEELQAMGMSEYRRLKLAAMDYELDRDILGANINLYYIFIFTAAIAVTVDFSAGSIKNTLSSAINRRKYFASKAVTVALLISLLFFLNTYLVYFSNLIFNGKNLSSGLWTVTKISLLQLPPTLALAGILTGIAFTVKKTSIYNVITIPLVIVFQLLLMNAIHLFKVPKKLFDFELQTMFSRLANDPAMSYILKSYAVCAVIAAVFIAIGYISFIKAEIK